MLWWISYRNLSFYVQWNPSVINFLKISEPSNDTWLQKKKGKRKNKKIRKNNTVTQELFVHSIDIRINHRFTCAFVHNSARIIRNRCHIREGVSQQRSHSRENHVSKRWIKNNEQAWTPMAAACTKSNSTFAIIDHDKLVEARGT